MFLRLHVLVLVVVGSLMAPIASAIDLQVGDSVSFGDNNWVWTIDILRPDLGGASLTAAGIDGSPRRLFVESERIFKVVDRVDPYVAGECYQLANNRFVWLVLGLTPAVADVTEAKAFVSSSQARPERQRRAVATDDLTGPVPCE